MKNARSLTVADLEKFDKITKDLIDEDDCDDETLADSDYIIGDLCIGGVDYTIIHGFPGDNPSGFIFNKDKTYSVGEEMKEDLNEEPVLWYRKITGNVCSYEDKFWYAK